MTGKEVKDYFGSKEFTYHWDVIKDNFGRINPDGFDTDCPGVEYANQEEADYAVITVYDPFAAAFERIPKAYEKIMEYLQSNGFKEKQNERNNCL